MVGVIDSVAGSGTTLDACRHMARECLAFDIAPVRAEILAADAICPWPNGNEGDLVFINPPYWSQQDKAFQGMASAGYEDLLSQMGSVFTHSRG